VYGASEPAPYGNHAEQEGTTDRVISFRPYRNVDPPALAEIWRSQPPLRGLAQPMSAAMLDKFVLAKPYFDREGLIVAVQDDRPVGFAHAGFGPNEDRSGLSSTIGVVCLVLVATRDDRAVIAARLVEEAERYLKARGVTQVFAIGTQQVNPFYVGVYGGSRLSGVLESDQRAMEMFTAAGYQQQNRVAVMQRSLQGFRPPIDRRQIQNRRSFHVETNFDPPTHNWWEACTIGHTERIEFTADTRGGERCGSVVFWNIQPLSAGWGVQAAGLVELDIHAEYRRRGLATFLIGEAMRQMQLQGFGLAEVHIPADNTPAEVLFTRLGFSVIDQAVEMSKEL